MARRISGPTCTHVGSLPAGRSASSTAPKGGKSVGDGGKSPLASSAGAWAWPVMAGRLAWTWLALGWLSERIMVSLCASAAERGSSSLKRTPGTLVAMAPNSPRAGCGASGLGSHVSCWACPPCR